MLRRSFLIGALASLAMPASARLIVNQLNGFGAGGASAFSAAYTDSDSDTVDRTTYTFSSASFGVADSTRRILVAAASRQGGSAGQNLSSMTIGGVAATILAQSVLGTFNTCAFAIATVPTGTTGDVVVNWAGGVQNCAIGVYRILGSSGTLYDSGTDGGEKTAFTASLDVPGGGAAFGIHYTGVSNSEAWTNLTEDAEGTSVGDHTWSVASQSFSSAQTALSITCNSTPNSAFGGMMIISLGP